MSCEQCFTKADLKLNEIMKCEERSDNSPCNDLRVMNSGAGHITIEPRGPSPVEKKGGIAHRCSKRMPSQPNTIISMRYKNRI